MRIWIAVTLTTLLLSRDSARAQSVSVMAQAIPVVTRADPTAGRQTLTEGYLSQPLVMTQASWDFLRAVGTLNLEGLTLKRGELNTGGYGEGFVDRRHPHAYVHELLVGAEGARDSVHASLFAGRGFAPFGSDDPMVRPFEKYPVNHHLAQVLERVVAVGAVRYERVIGEFGVFNGDEPTGPGAPPNYSRFGDSWASRVTLLPFRSAELSASYASVESPEIRAGDGLNQRKGSVVARYDRETSGSWRYAFAEWAHTNEYDRDALTTRLSSLLAEGGACRWGAIGAVRIEQTDRPEEQQLVDPFRTPRPEDDLSNLGISRWTTLTVSLSSPAARAGAFSGRPFVEVARIHVEAGSPAGLFNPDLRYGARGLWMISAGVRLRAGSMHDRMGRYGAALPPASMNGMKGMGAMPDMDMPTQGMTNRCAL